VKSESAKKAVRVGVNITELGFGLLALIALLQDQMLAVSNRGRQVSEYVLYK